MELSRPDVAAGARDIAVVIPGAVSVSLIASAAAVGAGFTDFQAFVFVGVTFAGASQLAALELLSGGGAVAVAVVTALVINARFAIFSASLAPHFRHLPARWRWLLGSVITTPAAVLSLTRFAGDSPVDAPSYYLGASLVMLTAWQAGTIGGILVGSRLPAGLALEFVVPLVFVCLLFQTLDGRRTVVAGVFGGLVALAGAGLPLGLGFVVGAGAGVAAGEAAHRIAGRGVDQ